MSMKLHRLGGLAVALGLAALPATAQAQAAAAAPAGADAAPMEAPAAAPAIDVQAITARIQAAQQAALQDPALSAANRAIGTLINATLPKVEPNYPAYAARAQTLKTDVAAAQAASDNAKLHELAAEATQLQANIAAAQEKAKNDPEVVAKLEAFKVDLFTKMVEIDPEVQDLVKQLEAARAQ